MEDLDVCSNGCTCPKFRVFIDTATATWGNADNVVIVEMADPDDLTEMSDSEISEFGDRWGTKV